MSWLDWLAELAWQPYDPSDPTAVRYRLMLWDNLKELFQKDEIDFLIALWTSSMAKKSMSVKDATDILELCKEWLYWEIVKRFSRKYSRLSSEEEVISIWQEVQKRVKPSKSYDFWDRAMRIVKS